MKKIFGDIQTVWGVKYVSWGGGGVKMAFTMVTWVYVKGKFIAVSGANDLKSQFATLIHFAGKMVSL